MALEDNALVLLPLQYTRLLELPREGSFSYRDQMARPGAVQPRTVTRYNAKGEKEISADEKFVAQKTITVAVYSTPESNCSRPDRGAPGHAARSSRSAIHSFTSAWRVTPRRRASRSSASTSQARKSTLPRLSARLGRFALFPVDVARHPHRTCARTHWPS
jgi:hypothetical protein